MRKDKLTMGTTWLVGVLCVCMIGNAAALADQGGATRSIAVSVVDVQTKAALPGAVIVYIDGTGQEAKAVQEMDGYWYLDTGFSQRKTELFLINENLVTAPVDVNLPLNVNATLRLMLQDKGLVVGVNLPGVNLAQETLPARGRTARFRPACVRAVRTAPAPSLSARRCPSA